jgi:hypothetical protein
MHARNINTALHFIITVRVLPSGSLLKVPENFKDKRKITEQKSAKLFSRLWSGKMDTCMYNT